MFRILRKLLGITELERRISAIEGEWNLGDKLRHKNSFNSVIFKSYSKGSDYFYHEESNTPLMCKHYIKVKGDN